MQTAASVGIQNKISGMAKLNGRNHKSWCCNALIENAKTYLADATHGANDWKTKKAPVQSGFELL